LLAAVFKRILTSRLNLGGTSGGSHMFEKKYGVDRQVMIAAFLEAKPHD
jgi:hypothetical protein